MDYEIRELDEDGIPLEEVILYVSGTKVMPAQGDVLEIPNSEGESISYVVLGTIHKFFRTENTGCSGYVTRVIVAVELQYEEEEAPEATDGNEQGAPPVAQN